MKRSRFALALAAGLAALPAGAAIARPASGVPATSSSRTIFENASDAKDLSTLTAAIKAAGLAETLNGPGPFTVFAPSNEAFRKLPPGTVDNLLKAENKAQLLTVLTYHVVPGLLTTRDILEQIKAGGGKAQLKTVEGEALTAELKGRTIEIVGARGSIARVLVPNAMQSNGVVHVVSTVLLP